MSFAKYLSTKKYSTAQSNKCQLFEHSLRAYKIWDSSRDKFITFSTNYNTLLCAEIRCDKMEKRIYQLY